MLEHVSFISSGNRIVGDLHLPDGEIAERLPAVVLIGPASSVRGQVPTFYAERFARLGYVALAFDHSSFGESGGQPRSDEDPSTKVEDAKSAVTFLTSHERVDPSRIAAVGVCAGGGYAPATAVVDRRIKAVATVSGLPDLRTTIVASPQWRAIMDSAQQAREGYTRTGLPTYVPFLADGELDLWRENAKKFYLTDRNTDPRWINQILLWSFDKMVLFAALDTAELLTPTPLLIIAGSRAETLAQSEALYERAAEPKQMHVIDGGTHFDFYDRPQFVDPAVATIDAFLQEHLNPASHDTAGEAELMR